jgi:hypothetical protein
MKKVIQFILKALKKINIILFHESPNFGRNWKIFPLKGYANNLIYKALLDDKPVMVARLGSTELSCLVNYLGVKNAKKYKSIKGYITSKTPEWWWNQSIIHQMQNWSGFFPAQISHIEHFCEMTINDMKSVDILGSWLKQEDFFKEELSLSKKVMLEDLEPFFTENPWTKALAGKKVLVVHPFADTIEYQYRRRRLLFENDLLPEFELKTIKAVQSIAKEETLFKDWFEALEFMKKQIAETDFDICILGCGAYGFPLAAYVKAIGKKAIHLGGVTQLLFGIKGARWEEYIVYPYTNLYNEYWVRPGEHEKPKNASVVEGACYW